MTRFHQPSIDPIQVPYEVGISGIESKYLPNYYDYRFTPQFWRIAYNKAMNYSDMSYLDTLYSWVVQSSPFLVSQMDKRVTPIMNRIFVIRNSDGSIDDKATKLICETKWFRFLIRSFIMSKFYGIRVPQIDIEKDRVADFPLRNIDIKNRAVRSMTFDYDRIASIDDYDNTFYIQPYDDQDFQFGMLLQISRAMIDIQQAYMNWNIFATRSSYPRTTLGYQAGNEKSKTMAENLARVLDNPTAVLISPYEASRYQKGERMYSVEMKSDMINAAPEAFRTFKENIMSRWSEIMQLITGGTLLGATEKNTNSEHLVEAHLKMYEDKKKEDLIDCLYVCRNVFMPKLRKLIQNVDLEGKYIDVMPDKTIGMEEFKNISDAASKQGIRLSTSFFERIGLDKTDFNTKIRSKSWVSSAVDKITEIFKPGSNGGYNGTEKDDKQP